MAQDDMFGVTLAQARRETMLKARDEAVRCPCCSKNVKVYHRKFNSSMALMLIYLYPISKKYPGRFIRAGQYLIKKHNFWPGDHGKLVWWGMLESKPYSSDQTKKVSGLYRVTEKGMLFVERKLLVPSHATEYLSKVEGFDGDVIGIISALGKKFDYYELMGEPAPAVPA